MKIIGFVGMPGSGTSEACSVARRIGLPVVVMGDVIRKEAARLGLEPTDENLGRVGNGLRARGGPAAVASKTLSEASRLGGDLVVVDGIRSKEEVVYFRANAEEFHLVEIWAPAEARVRRIASRGRSDDFGVGEGANAESDVKAVGSCRDGLKRTTEALEMRECRELGWGMCQAMGVADVRVKNEGSLEDLRRSIRDLLKIYCNPSSG